MGLRLMEEKPAVQDSDLVRESLAGNPLSFQLLVERYQDRLFALTRHYTRNVVEIEDIVQDAFLKAYSRLDSFQQQSSFYTWLYRIAINTAKNHLVARGRRPPGVDVDMEDAEFMDGADALREGESPEAALERDELSAAIDLAISQLPDDLRSAVTLREFDGLSYEQIAHIMDCPVGTVRSRIFRARESIDAHIEPLLRRRR